MWKASVMRIEVTPVSEEFAQGHRSDEECHGYINNNDRVLLKEHDRSILFGLQGSRQQKFLVLRFFDVKEQQGIDSKDIRLGLAKEAPWAQDRIHEGKLNRTIDTTLIYEIDKNAMTGQEATVYFDVCPTCKRVNPPKVENVPLKEEEHTNWLEFKKLTEGKKCAMERGLSINVDHPFVSVVRDFATDAFNVVVHMICITQSTRANEDEKKKARLCKSGSAELRKMLDHLASECGLYIASILYYSKKKPFLNGRAMSMK
ncbi:hypothetical protein Tco_0485303 [Tanacetum coccineum]